MNFDLSAVYGKTGKGLMAMTSKSKSLPSDLMHALSLVDGKSSIEELLAENPKFSDFILSQALTQLAHDGYVKVLRSGPNTIFELGSGGPSTILVAETDVEEFFAAQQKMEAQATSKTNAKSRKTNDLKANDIAAARAKAEAEELVRREAEIRARIETKAIARMEAERKAREEAAAQARAKAEEKVRARDEAEARMEAQRKADEEEQARAIVEAIAANEAARKAHAAAEANKKAEIEARKAAERKAREIAEAFARAEAEKRKRREAEEAAREKAEEKARKEAERRVREEAEALARAQAAERQRLADEAKARAKAEENARREAEQKAREEAEALARAEAEERKRLADEAEARAKAEEIARREAERKAREEAAAIARAEADERKRLADEAAAKAKAEEDARREAEQKAREEAAAIAQAEAEERQRLADEAEARAKAEKNARREAERKAREEAEALARAEAEEHKRIKAEEKARIRAEEKARKEVARKAREEAEALARAEAEERKRLAAEKKASAKAEAQAKAEEEARVKMEAKRKAREEAEALARAEAEELAKREAEERAVVEMEARAKAKAEAKARKEAEEEEKERAKIEARTRSMAETHAKEKAAILKPKIKKAPFKLGRTAQISLALLVLVPLVLLHVVSLNIFAPSIAKLAGDRIHEPVTISSVRASLWPAPHLRLEGVTIGNLQDVKIATVRVMPTLLHLFDETKILKLIEVESLAIDQDALPRVPGWVGSGSGMEKIQVARIHLKNTKLDLLGMQLPLLNMDVELDSGSKFERARISSADNAINIDVIPKGETFDIKIVAKNWQPPLPLKPTFDELNAKATATREGMAISDIEGHLYGGTIKGASTVQWGKRWNATGDFTLSRVDLSSATPALSDNVVLSGRLDAKVAYAMEADNLARLFDTPRIKLSFSGMDGAIGNINLSSGTIGRKPEEVKGGQTKFARLTGNMALAGNRYKFRQMKLESEVLKANGEIDVLPNKELTGKINVEMSLKSAVYRSHLSLSGSLRQPLMRRASMP